MNPATPWLRDQILTDLAVHGASTCAEVARRLPAEGHTHPCRARASRPCTRGVGDQGRNFLCAEGVHTFELPRRPAEVYRHLVALERAGKLARTTPTRSGAVLWARPDSADTTDEVLALERILEYS